MHAELTYTQLLSLLKNGDQQAFTQIYKGLWHDLYQAAFKRLQDREMSQDVVQNVFTSLWNRRQEADIKDLVPYLHTAVRFQVIKVISRKPKGQIMLEEMENIISSPFCSDNLLHEAEIQKFIEAFLKTLPKKRRLIYELFVNENLSTLEIAHKLGISQKTVQNQIINVNSELKERLKRLLTLLILLDFLTK